MAAIKRAITTATVSAILGIAALNAALYQGILSMFDVGRQFGATQAAQQDIAAQRQRIEALLTALDARLAAMEKAGGKPASPR